jgi:NAD(P)-dependent dehydrogenase (short-subunit alcohol dehydrogenase family)
MLWKISIFVICYIAYKYYKRRQYNKKCSKTFEDRHVFITGCDSGFGYDLAIRLDLLDFHVYAGCMTNVGEEEIKRDTTSKVKTLRIDVRNSDSIKNAVQTIKDMLPEGTGEKIFNM